MYYSNLGAGTILAVNPFHEVKGLFSDEVTLIFKEEFWVSRLCSWVLFAAGRLSYADYFFDARRERKSFISPFIHYTIIDNINNGTRQLTAVNWPLCKLTARQTRHCDN